MLKLRPLIKILLCCFQINYQEFIPFRTFLNERNMKRRWWLRIKGETREIPMR